jgi:hypothetical protein
MYTVHRAGHPKNSAPGTNPFAERKLKLQPILHSKAPYKGQLRSIVFEGTCGFRFADQPVTT